MGTPLIFQTFKKICIPFILKIKKNCGYTLKGENFKKIGYPLNFQYLKTFGRPLIFRKQIKYKNILKKAATPLIYQALNFPNLKFSAPAAAPASASAGVPASSSSTSSIQGFAERLFRPERFCLPKQGGQQLSRTPVIWNIESRFPLQDFRHS